MNERDRFYTQDFLEWRTWMSKYPYGRKVMQSKTARQIEQFYMKTTRKSPFNKLKETSDKVDLILYSSIAVFIIWFVVRILIPLIESQG